MSVTVRRLISLVVFLALVPGASGCIHYCDSGDYLQGPGTPVGITVLRIPFEKLVTAAPPPAGFSSTYQKMLLDRQRIAQKQAEREAQESEGLSGTNAKDAGDAAKKPAASRS